MQLEATVTGGPRAYEDRLAGRSAEVAGRKKEEGSKLFRRRSTKPT
jgi:hypothetical protein